MRRHAALLLRRLLSVGALLVALAAGEVLAQGAANVQVGRVRIGYLDELDAGWLPVSFPLENLGAESTVQLVAKVQAGGTTIWTSERKVLLPPKSRRVETLYVRITEGAQNVEVSVLAEDRPIHASNRGVTWRATPWRVQRREPPIPLHALLVREGQQERGLLSWLEPQPGSLTNPNSNAPAPVQLTSEQIEPRELPDRPEGFDGIDVVLLSKVSARSLDEPRRRALVAWLENGGRVILLPGADIGWLRDEFVKSLLPADAEVGEVDAPLTNFAQLVGRSQEVPQAKLFTVRSTRHGVRAGGETVQGKRVPYFTLFKRGLGDVVFVALDLESPPFPIWTRATPELGRILHGAIDPIPERRRVADDDRLAPWFEQALTEGELPSPLYLLPVVIVYVLCVGPLNHRLVRRSSTPVISVVTVPVISLIFTVVCFLAGYVVRGTSTSLDHLAVIEARPGDDMARAWAGLRIRSASSTSYAVAADAQLVATQRQWNEAERREGKADMARVNQDGGRFAFPELPLNLWERAFFQAHGPFVLGGAVTIEPSPRGCTVRNGTKLDLGPGVVFLPGTEGFRVPPLPPGGTATLDGSFIASVKDKAEVLAAIAETEAQKKVATRGVENFLAALRVETTYVAGVRSAPPALEVVGARPDRTLTILVIQGDDQARDEEVYKWATSVSRERWVEEYDDVLNMLAAIKPTSRWFRDAKALRSFIATAKYVDKAQDAYDAGDLDEARKMVLSVLALPELDRDSVLEIRGRLERWTLVASEVEAGCAAANSSAADRHFRAAIDKEPTANAFRRLAQARVEEIGQLKGVDAGTARDRGLLAAAAGDAGSALIDLRYSLRYREARGKLPEIQEGISEAEKRHGWAAILADGKGDALRRAAKLEIAQLLRDFLPLEDARRDVAAGFLKAHEERRSK